MSRERVLYRQNRGSLPGVDFQGRRAHHIVVNKGGFIHEFYPHGRAGFIQAEAGAKGIRGASVIFVGAGKEYGPNRTVHAAGTTNLPTDGIVHTSTDFATEARDGERISERNFAKNFSPFELDQKLTRKKKMLMKEDTFPNITFTDGNGKKQRAAKLATGVVIWNMLNAVNTEVCDAQIMQWEKIGVPEGVQVYWITKQKPEELAAYADAHDISRERLLSISDSGARALGVDLKEWPDMILRQTTVTKDGLVIHTEPVADQMTMPNRYAAIVHARQALAA